MDEENDTDNIFAEYEAADNEIDGRGHGDVENTVANPANPSAPEGERVVAPKRVVKNPRLKFDAERLIGERGIPVLLDHFKNVKFKGKGHEEKDLDKLLGTLEHWTHRLFPSMRFEDALKQIEKLGHKRPAKVCLQKIRMDMPVQYSTNNAPEEEEDDVRRNDDSEADMDPDDPFDAQSDDAEPMETDLLPLPSQTPSVQNVLDSQGPSTSGYVLGSSTAGLTDEQKKRMKLNRMLAAERRRKKVSSQSLQAAAVVESQPSTDTCDLAGESVSILASFEDEQAMSPNFTKAAVNDLPTSSSNFTDDEPLANTSVLIGSKPSTSTCDMMADEEEISTSFTCTAVVDSVSPSINILLENDESLASTSVSYEVRSPTTIRDSTADDQEMSTNFNSEAIVDSVSPTISTNLITGEPSASTSVSHEVRLPTTIRDSTADDQEISTNFNSEAIVDSVSPTISTDLITGEPSVSISSLMNSESSINSGLIDKQEISVSFTSAAVVNPVSSTIGADLITDESSVSCSVLIANESSTSDSLTIKQEMSAGFNIKAVYDSSSVKSNSNFTDDESTTSMSLMVTNKPSTSTGSLTSDVPKTFNNTPSTSIADLMVEKPSAVSCNLPDDTPKTVICELMPDELTLDQMLEFVQECDAIEKEQESSSDEEVASEHELSDSEEMVDR